MHLLLAVFLALYGLPMRDIGYPLLLCAFPCLTALFIGFARYYRRHTELVNLCAQILYRIDGLPDTKDLIEKDYQDLLRELLADKRASVSQADRKNTDLIDYYTLWVHQIKTPIAAMDLLVQASESPQSGEMKLALFRIEQYTEMALQYLRIEDMSSDLLIREYDLSAIISQAVRKYARVFIAKKIALHYDPMDCRVLTDEKWLLFVIEQILSNSLKYTRQGTVSIYLEPGLPKTLVIEDTGIGIRPEDLPRVFEKGFTGYNGRMDKKSTGLGLFLCKKTLTRLSHKISISSEPDKGTKVMIDLEEHAVPVD